MLWSGRGEPVRGGEAEEEGEDADDMMDEAEQTDVPPPGEVRRLLSFVLQAAVASVHMPAPPVPPLPLANPRPLPQTVPRRATVTAAHRALMTDASVESALAGVFATAKDDGICTLEDLLKHMGLPWDPELCSMADAVLENMQMDNKVMWHGAADDYRIHQV